MTKNKRWQGKVINVGGIKYKIKYVKSIQRCKQDKSEAAGQIDFQRRVIYLLNSLSPSEELVFLVHELCHAVLEAIVPPNILGTCEELEELIVGPFARILTAALQSAGLFD